MRILITGIFGGLGIETARLLAGNGQVVTGNGRNVGHLPDDIDCEDIIVEDINQGRKLRQVLRRTDVVVHLAALTGFRAGVRGYVESNLMTTASLLDMIREEGAPVKKLVYASSSAIYGEGAYECGSHGLKYPPMRPPSQLAEKRWDPGCPLCGAVMKPVPSAEEKKADSRHPYGITKYAAEAMLHAFSAEHGLPVISLRFPVLYGPARRKGFIPILFNRISRGETIALNEDGAQLRDYLFDADAARAVEFAVEKVETRAVFNVSCGEPVSLLQLVNAVENCVGKAAAVALTGHYRLNDVRHIFLDGQRIGEAGFRAGTSLAEGLDRVSEKMREGTTP